MRPQRLRHAYERSDKEAAERWAENVVWQHLSGMSLYEGRLPCDAMQLGRPRAAIGEAGVVTTNLRLARMRCGCTNRRTQAYGEQFIAHARPAMLVDCPDMRQ